MNTTSPLRYLVLNGKAAADDALRDAVQTARARGERVQVRVTWEPDDARRMVDEATALGANTVIAAGGDGTLGLVANALADLAESTSNALPALACIPMGTANDFATAAGIPDTPDAAWQVLHQPPVPIDLLRLDAADERPRCWVINMASGGFGTHVTTDTNPLLKKVLGGVAYVVSGIGQLAKVEPVRARLQGPGFDWQGGFLALGIGNGRQAGGGQPLCPDACIDDGLLDVTIIPEGEGMASALGTVLAQGKEGAVEALAVRARLPWVQVDALEGALVLNLDGEPRDCTTARVECVPQRLRMHLPTRCALLHRQHPDDDPVPMA